MNMQNIDVKAPPQPTSLTDTGLTMVMMRDILLKTVFRRHLSTATAISEAICLPINLTNELIEVVRGQKLLEAMGNRDAEGANEMAYELSDTGKARALDALAQSEYYGALPVPLKDYRAQTERQAVKDISISKARLHDAMSHLVLPDGLLDDLGPAINSGKSASSRTTSIASSTALQSCSAKRRLPNAENPRIDDQLVSGLMRIVAFPPLAPSASRLVVHCASACAARASCPCTPSSGS